MISLSALKRYARLIERMDAASHRLAAK